MSFIGYILVLIERTFLCWYFIICFFFQQSYNIFRYIKSPEYFLEVRNTFLRKVLFQTITLSFWVIWVKLFLLISNFSLLNWLKKFICCSWLSKLFFHLYFRFLFILFCYEPQREWLIILIFKIMLNRIIIDAAILIAHEMNEIRKWMQFLKLILIHQVFEVEIKIKIKLVW